MWRFGVILAVLVVVIPVSAVGNAPPPMNVDATPGGDTLMPCFSDRGPSCTQSEAIRDLHIVREYLAFDVDAGRTAGFDAYEVTVTATYDIENRGTETVSGPVRFIAAGQLGTKPHEVRFDGEPIDAMLGRSMVPPDWQLPERTPALEGDGDHPMFGWVYDPLGSEQSVEDYRDGTAAIETLNFDLAIPPGKHTLAVTYRLAPTHISKKPHQIAAIPYVLAPADEWGSFGGLDIEVRVPRGYQIASSLSLDDKGGAYVGSFDSLPADSLAITVGPDPSPLQSFWAHWVWLWSIPLFLLLASTIAYLLERRFRGWSDGRFVLLKLGAALIIGLATTVGWIVLQASSNEIFCPYPDVTRHLEIMVYIPGMIPVGGLALLATAIGFLIAHRYAGETDPDSPDSSRNPGSVS